MNLAGCKTPSTTQTHTAGGALAGAGLGAAIGHNLGDGSGDRDKGALIGAAAGALLGHQAGRQKQRTQDLERRLNTVEDQASTRTLWVTNTNGSRTPVVLRRSSGGMWIGPKGEHYPSFPGEDQLKSAYGF
jgi:outer membrane lipoprotein SlyB